MVRRTVVCCWWSVFVVASWSIILSLTIGSTGAVAAVAAGSNNIICISSSCRPHNNRDQNRHNNTNNDDRRWWWWSSFNNNWTSMRRTNRTSKTTSTPADRSSSSSFNDDYDHETTTRTLSKRRRLPAAVVVSAAHQFEQEEGSNDTTARRRPRPRRHRHRRIFRYDDKYYYSRCCRGGGGGGHHHNLPPPPPPVVPGLVVASDDDTDDTLLTSHDGLLRIAYQGEPGAYSEKATRELLGPNVIAIGRPSFEACFRAVANMECDYACLPIENSLGGSIHDNYDLMMRYDLQIVAEHDFRVQHCFLARSGIQREDIKFAISHPQALAQCDNYLRGLGITPIATYDTAGSAKMLANGEPLPDRCKPENTAAIASNLAGETYGLNCLQQGIEDDDTNFTRFLLLGRKSVVQYLSSKQIPAKTSVVFTFPNTPGGLYKCLACFSLRDIDFSKIESRPTSASLLNYLKFRSQQQAGRRSSSSADLPRFRYCFYLDFLASQLDEKAQNALAHLREHADFVRILGSYPQKSRLVGPVKDSVERVKRLHVPVPHRASMSLTSLPSDSNASDNTNGGGSNVQQLNIGIIGFGSMGQLLAKRWSLKHRVSCMDKQDVSLDAAKLGVDYYPTYETGKFLAHCDVVVVAVPLTAVRDTMQSLPVDMLRGKLLVEAGPLNAHPKKVMVEAFGEYADIDLITANPMFGTIDRGSGDDEKDPTTAITLEGRPMIYEKIRIANVQRCEAFLDLFKGLRCQLIEMNAEQHDQSVGDAEFVTHLIGRLLFEKQMLPPTPVVSKEYAALCDVADRTAGSGDHHSFDTFFGMFKYNHDRAKGHIVKLRDNLATIERQLVAKESYLEATTELHKQDRKRLLAETKSLLQEILTSGGLTSTVPPAVKAALAADPLRRDVPALQKLQQTEPVVENQK